MQLTTGKQKWCLTATIFESPRIRVYSTDLHLGDYSTPGQLSSNQKSKTVCYWSHATGLCHTDWQLIG